LRIKLFKYCRGGATAADIRGAAMEFTETIVYAALGQALCQRYAQASTAEEEAYKGTEHQRAYTPVSETIKKLKKKHMEGERIQKRIRKLHETLSTSTASKEKTKRPPLAERMRLAQQKHQAQKIWKQASTTMATRTMASSSSATKSAIDIYGIDNYGIDNSQVVRYEPDGAPAAAETLALTDMAEAASKEKTKRPPLAERMRLAQQKNQAPKISKQASTTVASTMASSSSATKNTINIYGIDNYGIDNSQVEPANICKAPGAAEALALTDMAED